MADINNLAPIIWKWEGGYINDPLDNGGATKYGVTLSTWRQCGYDKDGDGDIDKDDIKLLTYDDALRVLKKYYWNRWKADIIKNQSVANILVDWVWGSGKWGVIIPQRILCVDDDGIVGLETLDALNGANQKDLFDKVFASRQTFLDNIVKKEPKQSKFIRGWKNRLNDFKFKP